MTNVNREFYSHVEKGFWVVPLKLLLLIKNFIVT